MGNCYGMEMLKSRIVMRSSKSAIPSQGGLLYSELAFEMKARESGCRRISADWKSATVAN